jgi:glycosyltransferase involved in cell wall biosynthesis
VNVCHIISGDIWAGAECQVANLASELVKDEGLDVSAISFNPGRLSDELRGLGITVTCLPENELSLFEILKGIKEHLDAHHVDIIHCHGHKEHILGCVAGLFCKNRPKAMRTLHGMPEPFSGGAKVRSDIFGLVQELFLRYLTDRIVVVSQDMKRGLSKKQWANKMECIHNGVDLDKVKASTPREEMRRRLGIDNGAFVIGTACRLVAIKRIDLLLEAFRQVNQEHPSTLLLICGDGPLRLELQGRAEILGIEAGVRFLGHRDDIYDVMSTFDVFAMTSEHEGIPMVLLEAIALGVSIVAPRVGGIPEIVSTRGDKHILTASNSGPHVAEAIELMIGRNEVGTQKSDQAEACDADSVSVRRTASSTLLVYQAVVQQADQPLPQE